MKKMGIIYGSSTGTCESIAQTIAEKLGVASVDVIDASKITTEKVESYDILLAVEIQNPIVIHFVTVWELYMTS